jgi:hypothetical protein
MSEQKISIEIDGWRDFEVRYGWLYAANLSKSTDNKLMPPLSVVAKLVEQLLADKARLDAIEAIPFAVEIKFDPNQPKVDSVPSLRSQIDYFMQQQNEKKNQP